MRDSSPKFQIIIMSILYLMNAPLFFAQALPIIKKQDIVSDVEADVSSSLSIGETLPKGSAFNGGPQLNDVEEDLRKNFGCVFVY